MPRYDLNIAIFDVIRYIVPSLVRPISELTHMRETDSATAGTELWQPGAVAISQIREKGRGRKEVVVMMRR